MSDFTFNLIFYSALGVIFLLAILRPYLVAWERKSHMSRVAKKLGLHFSTNDVSAIPDLQRLALFGRGENGRFRHMMAGKYENIPVVVFDYEITCPAKAPSLDETAGLALALFNLGRPFSTDSHTYCLTVYVAQWEGLNLPNFELQPDSYREMDAVWFAFRGAPRGYTQLALGGDHALAEFEVHGSDSDVDAVPAMLGESVIRFFRMHRLYVAGSGNLLAVVKSDGVTSPGEIQVALDEALDLMELLRAQLRSAPSAASLRAGVP